jgi:hypothetical protein
LPGLQPLPIFQQFPLMGFSPGFNQSSFFERERTTDYFNRTNAENGFQVLVIYVEVRAMMLSTRFGKHSNDDTKEAPDLGHSSTLCEFISIWLFYIGIFTLFDLENTHPTVCGLPRRRRRQPLSIQAYNGGVVDHAGPVWAAWGGGEYTNFNGSFYW